jgi:hypothetical protein
VTKIKTPYSLRLIPRGTDLKESKQGMSVAYPRTRATANEQSEAFTEHITPPL